MYQTSCRWVRPAWPEEGRVHPSLEQSQCCLYDHPAAFDPGDAEPVNQGRGLPITDSTRTGFVGGFEELEDDFRRCCCGALSTGPSSDKSAASASTMSPGFKRRRFNVGVALFAARELASAGAEIFSAAP